MNKFNYVLVYWEDSAHLHFGWSPLEAVKEAFPDVVFCVTAGILMEETEDYVIVAQSSDQERTAISNTLKIPTNAIIKIHDLNVGKRHKR
jgi:hypothetical protein